MTFQELLDAQHTRAMLKIPPQEWRMLCLLLTEKFINYESTKTILRSGYWKGSPDTFAVLLHNLRKKLDREFPGTKITLTGTGNYSLNEASKAQIAAFIKKTEIAQREKEVDIPFQNSFYAICTAKGSFIVQTNTVLSKGISAPHLWVNYIRVKNWLHKHQGDFHEKLYIKKITFTTERLVPQPVERKGEND